MQSDPIALDPANLSSMVISGTARSFARVNAGDSYARYIAPIGTTNLEQTLIISHEIRPLGDLKGRFTLMKTEIPVVDDDGKASLCGAHTVLKWPTTGNFTSSPVSELYNAKNHIAELQFDATIFAKLMGGQA